MQQCNLKASMWNCRLDTMIGKFNVLKCPCFLFSYYCSTLSFAIQALNNHQILKSCIEDYVLFNLNKSYVWVWVLNGFPYSSFWVGLKVVWLNLNFIHGLFFQVIMIRLKSPVLCGIVTDSKTDDTSPQLLSSVKLNVCITINVKRIIYRVWIYMC